MEKLKKFQDFANESVSDLLVVTSKVREDYTSYYVGDIQIGWFRRYQEHFSSFKNGQYSNLRDKIKPARMVHWDDAAIQKLTGNKDFSSMPFMLSLYPKPTSEFLVSEGPDLNYGWAGPKEPKIKNIEKALNTIKK